MVKNDDFEFIMKPHYYCSYFKAFEAFTFELLIHDFFVHIKNLKNSINFKNFIIN